MENAKKEKKYTTVQITKKARALLKQVALVNKRSMTKQIEWLVLQEERRLGVETKKDE